METARVLEPPRRSWINSILVPALVITTVLLLLEVCAQRLELDQVRADAEMKEEKLAKLRESLVGTERKARLFQSQAEALKAKTAVVSSEEASSGQPEVSSDEGTKKKPKHNSRPKLDPNDPEVLRRKVAQQESEVRAQYSGLLKALNLKPGKADALVTLLINKKLAEEDVAATAIVNGGDTLKDGLAFADAIKSTKTDIEGEIHDLLGDDGYDEYRAQVLVNAQDRLMTKLQQTLATAGAPLNQPQAEALINILQNSHIGHLTDTVLVKTKPVLTPTQWQAVNQFYAVNAASRPRAPSPLPPHH